MAFRSGNSLLGVKARATARAAQEKAAYDEASQIRQRQYAQEINASAARANEAWALKLRETKQMADMAGYSAAIAGEEKPTTEDARVVQDSAMGYMRGQMELAKAQSMHERKMGFEGMKQGRLDDRAKLIQSGQTGRKQMGIDWEKDWRPDWINALKTKGITIPREKMMVSAIEKFANSELRPLADQLKKPDWEIGMPREVVQGQYDKAREKYRRALEQALGAGHPAVQQAMSEFEAVSMPEPFDPGDEPAVDDMGGYMEGQFE